MTTITLTGSIKLFSLIALIEKLMITPIDQRSNRKRKQSARDLSTANMNPILEFFSTLLLVIYYWLEAIVLTFIPASLRGKSVAGETVLVTGAGKLEFYFSLRSRKVIKIYKLALRKLLTISSECYREVLLDKSKIF